jgi:inorganic pyrophosphatase
LTQLLSIVPDGKPENSFAFSGEAKNQKYAMEIVHECNEAWKRLIAGSIKSDISLYVHHPFLLPLVLGIGTDDVDDSNNVNVSGPGFCTTSDAAYAALPADSRAAPAPIDPSIDKTFFISGHAVRSLHSIDVARD